VRKRVKIAGAFLLVAVAVGLMSFWPKPADSLKFDVVDLWTGKRLTQGTVEVVTSWVPLPRKLAALGWGRRSRVITIDTKRVELTGIRRKDPDGYILINVPGYEEAFIRQHRSEVGDNPEYYTIQHAAGRDKLVRESPYQYVRRDRPFTIAIEPINRPSNTPPAVEQNPPTGSEERAIAAVRRYAAHHGYNLRAPDETDYVNGYWEVRYHHGSLRPGADVCYHVSADGDVLNRIASE